MDVLLIKPPYSRLRSAGQAPTFPLGLGYIAAALEKSGFQVGIYNGEICSGEDRPVAVDKQSVFSSRSQGYRRYQETLNRHDFHVWQEIETLLRQYKPRVIGLSVLTVEAGSARKVSAMAREILPDGKIIWGGVHPTFCADQCLAYPEVDFVIRGEGEETAVSLCRHLISGGLPLDELKGISYRSNGAVRHHPPAEPLPTLNHYPEPARHLLLNTDTKNLLSLGAMILSRGCPWACTFCSSPQFWGRRVRFRSTGEILQEMSHVINQYGIRSFTFWDDAFTLSRKQITALCLGMLEQKISATWKTATRIDLLDSELLGLMRRAGCVQLQLGIESGSPEVSKMICKEIDLKRVPGAIRMINQAGIASGAFFMAGFPRERAEDLEETFKLMKKLESAEIVLNVFDPMPGSPIFDEVERLGLLQKPVDWCDFPLWPDRHFLAAMEPAAFDRAMDEISRWTFQYNRRPINFLRRMKPQVGYFLKKNPLYLAGRVRRFFGHA